MHIPLRPRRVLKLFKWVSAMSTCRYVSAVSHGDDDYTMEYYDYLFFFWVISMLYHLSIISWAGFELCKTHHDIFILKFVDSGYSIYRGYMRLGPASEVLQLQNHYHTGLFTSPL